MMTRLEAIDEIYRLGEFPDINATRMQELATEFDISVVFTNTDGEDIEVSKYGVEVTDWETSAWESSGCYEDEDWESSSC